MHDISNLDDITLLVDSFYEQVRRDELIGPVFEARIGINWGPHLDKMYRFWQTVLLDERAYQGSPFPPHAQLDINQEHFDRWITLFNQTVDTHFKGEKAEEAKWRAGKMGELFAAKLDWHRKHGNKIQ